MNKEIMPFAGFPKTVVTRGADGFDAFTIELRELTPLRAKIADKTGTILALGLSAASLAFLFGMPVAPDLMFAAALLAGPLALVVPLRLVTRQMLRLRTTIRMSRDEITIGGWLRQERFDRRLEHGFALYANDFEKEEAERIDHESRTRRGRPLYRPRYYAHSPHLVLEYLGHRNDVATITGTARAAKILGRLQGCDDHLRRQDANGSGLTFTPLDERGPRVGGLPTE